MTGSAGDMTGGAVNAAHKVNILIPGFINESGRASGIDRSPI